MINAKSAGGRGWRNSSDRYGWTSQLFHWIIAFLVIATLGLGWLAGAYPRETTQHEAWMVVHKSFGLSIFLLMIMRLSWILYSPAPSIASHLKPWERRTAWWVHKLLYVVLFAMPLSGVLLSQAVQKPIAFFGLFELPQWILIDPAIPPGQRSLVIAGAIMHKVIFIWVLYALLLFHISGIAKHHLIDKDKSALHRMFGK